MTTKTLKIKDGELHLEYPPLASGSIDEVISRAYIVDGFKFSRLGITSVTKNMPWKNTEESTVPKAILYLKKHNDNDNYPGNYLITHIHGTGKYGLFKYEWIS